MTSYVILEGWRNDETEQMLVADEVWEDCLDEGGDASHFFTSGVRDMKKIGEVQMDGDEVQLEMCYTTRGC